MDPFKALVVWPSAPLTDSLVRKSLSSLDPPPAIVDSLNRVLISSPEKFLQWSTYDAIDHDLTHSAPSGSKVLSSSYIIRKALIRKHYLSRCIHNYLTKHSHSVLRSAVPQTWDIDLSFADELDEMWSDDLFDLGQELDKADPEKWWMLKPGMADRGMGIRLFHSKNDLTKIFEEFELSDSEEETEKDHQGPDTAVATSQLRHFVIQEYLSKPLLLDPSEVPLDGSPRPSVQSLHGHKFHLRVYCVASGALSVYMYTRILSLFSAVPYSSPVASDDKSTSDTINDNLAAHLTNTSLQTERGEAGVRLLDELIGCHVLSSSSQTQSLPSEQPHKRARQERPARAMAEMVDVDRIRASRTEELHQVPQRDALTTEDVQDIKSQIADVLAETFKAALDMSVHFQPLPNAFELFGVDFLVTHHSSASSSRRYQVHLLEVNSEPAIELTGPRLTWILEDLFCAIGKVCVAHFFDPVIGEEKWEVGQTKENLRKCMDVEVRGASSW